MNFDFEAAKGKQVRNLPVADLRAEGRDGSDEFSLVGYAARYDVLSHNLGGFRERLQKGCFRQSVADQMKGEGVVCLWNHNPNNGILGRTTAGTMTISEDEKGLRFRCQLDKNQQAHRDLHSSVARGDVNSCSFAFTVPDGGQQWTPGKDPDDGTDCAFRTLTNVVLLDCSPVCYPAYPQTSVDSRHRLDAPADLGRIESLRKLALADAKLRGLTVRKSNPASYDYAALADMCDRAMELASAAWDASDLIDDTLDDWDDDTRNAAVYHKALRAAHADAHAAISGAGEAFARTRLALSRCMKK